MDLSSGRKSLNAAVTAAVFVAALASLTAVHFAGVAASRTARGLDRLQHVLLSANRITDTIELRSKIDDHTIALLNQIAEKLDAADFEGTDGVRLLIVWDANIPLTDAQRRAVYSPVLNVFLNTQVREWRIWDTAEKAQRAALVIKGLLATARERGVAGPALVIKSGARIEIVPLPATDTEIVALIEKYLK